MVSFELRKEQKMSNDFRNMTDYEIHKYFEDKWVPKEWTYYIMAPVVVLLVLGIVIEFPFFLAGLTF